MMLKNTKKIIKWGLSLIFVISVIGLSGWEVNKSRIAHREEIEQFIEKDRLITCPALLSIARSPRDTLIVMKNKSVCVQYVFDSMN